MSGHAARSLLALCASLGCASAEGDVFRPAGPALPCAGAPFTLDDDVGAAPRWGGALVTIDGVVGIAFAYHDSWAYRIGEVGPPAAASPRVEATLVADQDFTIGGQPIEDGAGRGWLVFGNHSLAGHWHVYASPWRFGSGAVTAPFTLLTSADNRENIGPQAAAGVSGDAFGVAYRQDNRVAFTVADAAGVVATTLKPDSLPLPFIGRVVGRPSGYTVLFTRATASLAHYGLDAAEAGGLELTWLAADVRADGERLIVAGAGPAAIERADIDPAGGAPVTTSTGVPVVGSPILLKIAAAGDPLGIAFTEGDEAGVATRLRFAWSGPAGAVDFPPLAIHGSGDGVLDAVAVAGGALVIYSDAGALRARFYCAPGR